MTRSISKVKYEQVLSEGSDYCECCGGLYEFAGLSDDAMMPDLDNPLPGGGYPLLSVAAVCFSCTRHCEDGPCQPDRVVRVSDAAVYNQEIDEINHINLSNREKPWLPVIDGA